MKIRFDYDPFIIVKYLNMSTEIGFNDVNLLSSISNLFQCNLLESDEIPSAIQISTNPIGSLRTAFCFTLERIIDTIKKIRNNNSLQSIEIIFDNILPTLKELLVNLSDSNILPSPSSYLIRNLLMLYDVSRLMRSTI